MRTLIEILILRIKFCNYRQIIVINCLKVLKWKGVLLRKNLSTFTIEVKKAANLGKLYLLPKINKPLENVPGRPVISNCGTPLQKVSKFLDSQLKPVMQSSLLYIKDSGDFIKKIKNIGAIP